VIVETKPRELRSAPRDEPALLGLSADTAVRPISRPDLAYAELELPAAQASDFDWRTIAIVAGIIIFKLLMLSVLLVAF
jgi:hypothetical protein